MIKYIAGFFAFLSILSMFSCNDDEVLTIDENDTTRGLWGSVRLFDEAGNEVFNLKDVLVKIHCIDTLSVDTSGNALEVFDTLIQLQTDINGMWSLSPAPGGKYFISFEKDGYAQNKIYNFSYDTARADTLEYVHLSMKPQGSIEINSVSLSETVLDIDRVVHFPNIPNYTLSTWYFFDTVPNVSHTQYIYSYVSGAVTNTNSNNQNLVIKKPLDKLYQSGIREGQMVYVRAYVDNKMFTQFQVAEKLWEYPNISEGSSIKSFVMPVEE